MPTRNVGPGSGPELQEIADVMGGSKKFVVITGAGISTNCGIPDFRSENGLYSLIQAQYDAALQNPPWEDKDNYDIDDRPKKKRKRWFYEVVREDGTVVEVIDQEAEHSAQSQEAEASTSSRKSSRSKSTTPSSSPLSSPPPSSATATPPSEQAGDSFIESSQSSRPDLPNLKGRDLFDSMVWKDPFTTSIFYMFISSLRQKIQDVSAATPTHEFIKALEDCGRLVRNYTQNIDCLEDRIGLSTDVSAGPGSRTRFTARSQRDNNNLGRGVACVQLHGSLAYLRCGLCLKLCDWDEGGRAETILSGQAPDCPSCTDYNAKRTGRGRRGLAVGRLRPDIVLYGEDHPNATQVGPIITHDLALGPDVLLILGTSLKVHGLKVIVKEFAKTVHDRGGTVIFVNRTKPPESTWGDVIDYWVGWDCDAWVLDLKERRADVWLPPSIASEESKSRRQSSNDTKGETVKRSRTRPQSTRDDRSSGAYHTFKILDNLRKIPGKDGELATREIYWQDLRRLTGDARGIFKPFSRTDSTSLTAPKDPFSSKRKSLPAAGAKSKSTSSRKSLPASKTTANTSKKRKSYPAAVRDDKGNAAYLVTKIWDDLRKYAPNLPEHPPKDIASSGRIALSELHQNVPSHLKPFSFNYTNKSKQKSPPNHLPNIAGLDMPDMNMPNLVTHPPSGLTIPLHTPKQLPPRTSHAYGTRSSRQSHLSKVSTIVVQPETKTKAQPTQVRLPSWGSTESTIVVATPPPGQESASPSSSAPMTPGSKRIKRMGSIGAILSSPEDGAAVFEDAQEKLEVSPDGAEVFYDAE